MAAIANHGNLAAMGDHPHHDHNPAMPPPNLRRGTKRRVNVTIGTAPPPTHAAGRMRFTQLVGLVRVGLPTSWHTDLYHRALTAPWYGFLALAATVYLAANVLFAGLYLLQPGAIANARPGSFLDAFFFSVETFGTIGYGVLSPATTYANAIMTLETLVGIMLVALTTGITFARVSRPTARVMFARIAVVSGYNGVPTLMVRMGNARLSQILSAEVGLTLMRNEQTKEGNFMRRFYDLKLLRSHTPIFTISFLAMHPLDEDSPLHGATHQTMEAIGAEILVTVTGLEQTTGQTVHARTSYFPSEIVFGHRFADMFGFTDDGRRAIDYRRFHLTEPADAHAIAVNAAE